MFQALSSEELRILNKDRYSVRFHEGEVILKQGTRADYLISVVEGVGKAKRGKISPDELRELEDCACPTCGSCA